MTSYHLFTKKNYLSTSNKEVGQSVKILDHQLAKLKLFFTETSPGKFGIFFHFKSSTSKRVKVDAHLSFYDYLRNEVIWNGQITVHYRAGKVGADTIIHGWRDVAEYLPVDNGRIEKCLPLGMVEFEQFKVTVL